MVKKKKKSQRSISPRDYVWGYLKESMGCWKGTTAKNKNLYLYIRREVLCEEGYGPI